MKDGQCINKYVVEFNRLASQVRGYGDDEICWVGKLQALEDLQHLTQEIDMHYWECKEEIQWANRHQTSAQNSSNKSTSSAPNSGHNKSAPNSAPSSKTNNNNNNKKSTNASSSNPELTNKLGKDGKLTAAERKRHYDLKLCMFYGGNGHFTDKCKKKVAKNKAKACAAKAIESPPEQLGSTSGSTPEAKK
ncbi:hypothetical protein ID866_13375 [Astraeus odoratus]|nr:hypothetical protein ID866_13375 [Astraeus odoratus]